MASFGQPIKTTPFGISSSSSSLSSLSSSSSSFMATVPKPHVFENYNTIVSQFQSINSFDSFVQCNLIQPHELIAITTIVTESIAKMAELSEFFIRKTNDVNVSTSICDRLQRMSQLHYDTLSTIYSFSNISKDVSGMTEKIAIHNLSNNANVIGYMTFEIINHYRVLNPKLEELFRRLITYASILKDKI